MTASDSSLPCIAIAGPTACGKTASALALAAGEPARLAEVMEQDVAAGRLEACRDLLPRFAAALECVLRGIGSALDDASPPFD